MLTKKNYKTLFIKLNDYSQYNKVGQKILSIYSDKFNNIYIGTNLGLVIMNYNLFNFWNINSFLTKTNNASNVLSILEDVNKGKWIGTERGIFYLNDGNRKVFNIRINAILKDSKNNIWIATTKGLSVFDKQKEDFILKLPAKGNDFNFVYFNRLAPIIEDKQGNLWLGTPMGVYECNINSKKYIIHKHDSLNIFSISSNVITSMYKDKNGTIWIGTRNGLNRYNQKSNNFRQYFFDPNKPINNFINSICEDSSGKLLVGTSKGLNIFDLNTNKNFRPTCSELSNLYIAGILVDKNNNIWLSSSRGLFRYNQQLNSLANFGYRYGQFINNFRSGSYLNSNSGLFYFGGENGFISFNPNDIKIDKGFPNIVITDFKINNKSVLSDYPISTLDSYGASAKIILPYNQNNLLFKFAALKTKIPSKSKYLYFLEGFSKEWLPAAPNFRTANFTNLDPGEYTFKVKASNSDGLWNKKGTSMKIIITPPFWKTWWAYLIYFLTIIGVLFSYIRHKIAAQQKELLKKEEELKREQEISERLRNIDRLKDEFLANTSHELRTPLHGIIGIAESLIDGAAGVLSPKAKSNLSMIISSGNRLASLVNDILDFSKIKNNELKLDKKVVDMRILTDFVLALSKSMADKKRIALKNKIERNKYKVYGDENRLQQIMFNLVGNAIKFTEEGSVTVYAEENNNFVKTSIQDTGMGIPPEKHEDIFKSFEQLDGSSIRSQSGTGLGLSITKDLVQLHGGEIFLESEVGKGSVFSFTIPKGTGEIENKNVLKELSKVKEGIENAAKSIRDEKNDDNYEFSILIVDDEEINQQVLENQLTLARYKVTTASTGKRALELIENGQKFDLVLLDIMMPELSGIEVAQKIRELYLPNELPIIMVTAKNRVSDLQEGLEVGANDYIAKPFSKEEMLSRVKTHLNLLKINTSYARFLPKEFLETLGKESIIDVRLGDQIQDEMTIVFSDIRSFTSISEKMTPKENFDFLNEYLSTVIPSIKKFNGFIDKYIGDAFMAIFPKQPEDALKSSIEVMNALHKFNLDRLKSHKFPINIGIGIHTGVLMLGTIGEESRMDGTVISDAVNFASRLEGLTKVYGASILISKSTLTRIGNIDRYNYRFLGKVQVKGKKNAMEIYEFFDGDEEQQKKLKAKTKIDFVNALKAYFSKDFAAAVMLFKQVLKKNPEDKAANLYLKNSANYVVNDVPDDWEGVEVMFSK